MSASAAASAVLPVARVRRPWPLYACGVLFLLAVIGPWIAPYDPLEVGVGGFSSPPSLAHPLGTDVSGRDVLSRVLAGTRVSVFVSLCATAAAGAIGGSLGAIAALAHRRLSELIMRMMDVVMSLPGILLAIVLATALGGGTSTTILALTAVYTPSFARVVRGAILGELQEDYVVAAGQFGTGKLRLLTHHVGINVVVPIAVFATVIMADAVILEGGLSFIGLGVPPPAPSWGNVIADGRQVVLAGDWWISASGGAALVIAVYTLIRTASWLAQRLDDSP